METDWQGQLGKRKPHGKQGDQICRREEEKTGQVRKWPTLSGALVGVENSARKKVTPY